VEAGQGVIPQLVYSVSPRSVEDVESLVRTAIGAGYRHIDLTSFPAAAPKVARGLGGVDVFVTVPVGADEPEAQLATMRAQLGVERLDLCVLDLAGLGGLGDEAVLTAAWLRVLKAVHAGGARMAGVRNATAEQIHQLADAGSTPVINQVVLNPWTPRPELRHLHQRLDIATGALNPMARWPELLNEPPVTSIARRLGRTEAQIVTRWHLQLGTIPITSPVHAERIVSNARVFDFELSHADMAAIATLRR
jgi:2,5-diketo-D-gluconate reductase A